MITVLKIREIRATKIQSSSLLGKKHCQGAEEGWITGFLSRINAQVMGPDRMHLRVLRSPVGITERLCHFSKVLVISRGFWWLQKGNRHTCLQKGQEEWCRKQQCGWSPLSTHVRFWSKSSWKPYPGTRKKIRWLGKASSVPQATNPAWSTWLPTTITGPAGEARTMDVVYLHLL